MNKQLPIKAEIVTLRGAEPFTTSLAIAEGVGLPHASVIKLVRRHQKLFEELHPIGFEIQKGAPLKHGGFGKSTEFAILNEDQATFLMTLFKNSEPVLAFKLRLVKAFRRALDEIARLSRQRTDPAWIEARENGKCIRSVLTSAVQSLERLAEQQGGKKVDARGREGRHYYESITRMIYKALFGDGTLGKVRDQLEALHLTFLSVCEQACAREIERLCDLGVDYHAIYAEARRRVIATVDGLAASKLEGRNAAVRLAWENKEPA